MSCACGYSKNYPVCDGTHSTVKRVKVDIVNKILEVYRDCPNVEELNGKLKCTVEFKHDDCEKVRNILYKITKNKMYE
jgi:hypothetical protein